MRLESGVGELGESDRAADQLLVNLRLNVESVSANRLVTSSGADDGTLIS